jgi:alpha-tubulin suppressor-like RCC1 family protein
MNLAPAPRPYIALALLLLAACADPDSTDKKSPDLGADLGILDMSSRPDMVDEPDMAPDQDMSAPDPCAQVSCGEGGRCVVVNASPSCACPEGFVADGLRCVAAPGAPSLDNLPAAESGGLGQPDSFQLMASDPNADPLTFALNGVCPFAVNVDSAGEVAWTCPPTTAACDVVVTATDAGGLSDQDTLSITCVNGLPAFTSTAPTAATEGQELRYAIACADPDGTDVTLSVAQDDTCGGAIEGDVYVLTPDESRGGMTCLLRVLCSDGEASEAQSSMLSIAEVNEAPILTNLPASSTAQSGRPGSFMITADDADLPAQPLVFSATNTCSFPVQVDAASGLVSFVCGASAESCEATISVSDGQDSAQGTLSIACANGAPAIETTAPNTASEGARYSYTLSCSDPDGDPLTISLLPSTTCPGATLTQGAPGQATVSFTPGETRGGTICALGLRCADGLFNTDQTSAVIIAEVNDAPALTNLPAAVNALWGRAGSFTATATDTDLPAQALTFSLASKTCSFPVTVSAAGTASFTCGAAVESCTATLRVSDGAATTSAALDIACQNHAPTFSSTAPAAASEGARYAYAPTCADADSDATHITLVSTTCGGALANGTFSFTPTEAQGGASCTYTVRCSDSLAQVDQNVAVIIAETNSAPALTNLPAAVNARWGRAGSFNATATDSDQPAQALTFSLVGETCSFPVTVSAAGAASFTCGAAVESCTATVRVSDGQTNAQAALAIDCTNTAPTVTGVAITPAMAYRNTALSCAYNFADADGDADQSTIAWFINGAPAGSGATLNSGYSSGDTVRCEVTPRDGVTSLAPLSAQRIISNRAPSVTNVALTPNTITSARQLLTCAYTFADPDGDADNSSVEWLVAGVAVATGPTFSNYLPGDSIACRVTPNDSTTDGGAVTSPALQAPDQLDLAAGIGHTCAIKNGALFCWGDNAYGQLGDGTTTDRTSPTQVTSMSANVTAIAAGGKHTCAIQSGALKCWGDNASRQGGNGTSAIRMNPTQVVGLTSNVTKITAGYQHTCAIHSGELKCWGDNSSGQIGDGTVIMKALPTYISTPPNIRHISAGFAHTCGSSGDYIFCWGDNTYGQLGNGTTADRSTPTILANIGPHIGIISAGGRHTCATQENTLKCWGYNRYGQLGDGTSTDRTTPVQVTGMSAGISSITTGLFHTCAIQNGSSKCWGYNSYGQLGDSSTNDRTTPVQVTGISADSSAIVAGSTHTCAIQNNAIKCWGYNNKGQLAKLGPTSTSPLTVSDINSPTAVSAGYAHACAIQSGALYCWGNNNSGQAGHGSLTSRGTPLQVIGLSFGVTAVSAGGAHTCAIHSGALKCWGNNGYGQLGDNTTTNRTTPVQVAGMTANVTAVTTGDNHTCAIQSGALKCWGDNNSRQLGDGTTTSRTSPTQVTGMTSTVSAIDAGSNHTCAIQNKSAKCWGDNTLGQLGDGTTTDRSTPVQVSGLTTNISDISANTGHTCAIQLGQLYCWGDNSAGQLGDGTTTDRTTPVPVIGIPALIIQVLAGDKHTCANQSGALKCWGSNDKGQLGDSTTTDQPTPVQVTGLTSNVSASAAGDSHTCAIQNSVLKCWGDNSSGQLGFPIHYPAPHIITLP